MRDVSAYLSVATALRASVQSLSRQLAEVERLRYAHVVAMEAESFSVFGFRDTPHVLLARSVSLDSAMPHYVQMAHHELLFPDELVHMLSHEVFPVISDLGDEDSAFERTLQESLDAYEPDTKRAPDSVIGSLKEFEATKECLAATPECVICKDELVVGEQLVALPHCSHKFHRNCITPWLRKQHTCPVCRVSVVEATKCAVRRLSATLTELVAEPHLEPSHIRRRLSVAIPGAAIEETVSPRSATPPPLRYPAMRRLAQTPPAHSTPRSLRSTDTLPPAPTIDTARAIASPPASPESDALLERVRENLATMRALADIVVPPDSN